MNNFIEDKNIKLQRMFSSNYFVQALPKEIIVSRRIYMYSIQNIYIYDSKRILRYSRIQNIYIHDSKKLFTYSRIQIYTLIVRKHSHIADDQIYTFMK